MSMLSVQVTEWGAAPEVIRTSSPPPTPPPADSSTVQIRLLAAGLHNVVRSRASGKHYSASSLPHTLGVDGVGVDVATGKKVYFTTVRSGTGSFAQVVNVRREDVEELPQGVGAVQAAALMNPVMSSWMALRTRVDLPKTEWTAFVMGVTSMSGRLAVKVARAFGASRVVGAARNEEAMKKLDLDAYVVLREGDISGTDFSPAADADVVLDYLYGPYVPAYLLASRSRRPVTWVVIGGLAGSTTAEVPSAVLRKRDVTVRGAGPGAWRVEDLGPEVKGMLGVLEGVRMEEGKVVEVRMEEREVGEAWEGRTKGRVVIVNRGNDE